MSNEIIEIDDEYLCANQYFELESNSSENISSIMISDDISRIPQQVINNILLYAFGSSNIHNTRQLLLMLQTINEHQTQYEFIIKLKKPTFDYIYNKISNKLQYSEHIDTILYTYESVLPLSNIEFYKYKDQNTYKSTQISLINSSSEKSVSQKVSIELRYLEIVDEFNELKLKSEAHMQKDVYYFQNWKIVKSSSSETYTEFIYTGDFSNIYDSFILLLENIFYEVISETNQLSNKRYTIAYNLFKYILTKFPDEFRKDQLLLTNAIMNKFDPSQFMIYTNIYANPVYLMCFHNLYSNGNLTIYELREENVIKIYQRKQHRKSNLKISDVVDKYILDSDRQVPFNQITIDMFECVKINDDSAVKLQKQNYKILDIYVYQNKFIKDNDLSKFISNIQVEYQDFCNFTYEQSLNSNWKNESKMSFTWENILKKHKSIACHRNQVVYAKSPKDSIKINLLMKYNQYTDTYEGFTSDDKSEFPFEYKLIINKNELQKQKQYLESLDQDSKFIDKLLDKFHKLDNKVITFIHNSDTNSWIPVSLGVSANNYGYIINSMYVTYDPNYSLLPSLQPQLKSLMELLHQFVIEKYMSKDIFSNNRINICKPKKYNTLFNIFNPKYNLISQICYIGGFNIIYAAGQPNTLVQYLYNYNHKKPKQALYTRTETVSKKTNLNLIDTYVNTNNIDFISKLNKKTLFSKECCDIIFIENMFEIFDTVPKVLNFKRICQHMISPNGKIIITFFDADKLTDYIKNQKIDDAHRNFTLSECQIRTLMSLFEIKNYNTKVVINDSIYLECDSFDKKSLLDMLMIRSSMEHNTVIKYQELSKDIDIDEIINEYHNVSFISDLPYIIIHNNNYTKTEIEYINKLFIKYFINDKEFMQLINIFNNDLKTITLEYISLMNDPFYIISNEITHPYTSDIIASYISKIREYSSLITDENEKILSAFTSVILDRN